jgi:hypothetical protein
LTSDIFNFSPPATARNGLDRKEIVTGCIVVNVFKSECDLINNDADVFSKLFSDSKRIIFAGEKDQKKAIEHQKLIQEKDPKNDLIYGYQEVTDEQYSDFIKDMKKKIRETSDISAFGRSKLLY